VRDGGLGTRRGDRRSLHRAGIRDARGGRATIRAGPGLPVCGGLPGAPVAFAGGAGVHRRVLRLRQGLEAVTRSAGPSASFNMFCPVRTSSTTAVSWLPAGTAHVIVSATDCMIFSSPSSDCDTVWYGAARTPTVRLAARITPPSR